MLTLTGPERVIFKGSGSGRVIHAPNILTFWPGDQDWTRNSTYGTLQQWGWPVSRGESRDFGCGGSFYFLVTHLSGCFGL